MEDTDTFELTNSTHDQRSNLQGRIGYFRIRFEKIDETTWNAVVNSKYSDQITDWCDENKLAYRMI